VIARAWDGQLRTVVRRRCQVGVQVCVYPDTLGIRGQAECGALDVQHRRDYPEVEIVDTTAGRTDRRVRQSQCLSGEIAAELGAPPQDHVRPPVPGEVDDVACHSQRMRPGVAL